MIDHSFDLDRCLNQAFPSIDAEALRGLVRIANVRAHLAGETIPIGDARERPFVLLGSGRVEARASRDRRMFVQQIYRPGELINPHGDEDVAHVASHPATTVWMPPMEFSVVMFSHPELMQAVLAMVSRRLRETSRRTKELALLDIADRIWAEVQRSAEPIGDSGERRLRLTQQRLADRVGSCRETVSRVLTSLMRQHKLVKRGGAYILPAPDLAATA